MDALSAGARGPRPIRRLLIANRGEIAIRIARAAREHGVVPLGIYSHADARARHVAAMDDALEIGPGPASESYLDAERILAAARALGADALHPGYGFLSERAPFAAAVEAAGLVWIGPSPAAIAAVGDKAQAKRLAREAGVPVVPGYDGDDRSDAQLAAQAGTLRFPLLIKARAGGGGRGMREVREASAFGEALAAARREAQAAFGDDGVLLERLIERPRHVEVQILADEFGNVVQLGERECSIQRRHQKILEEAPSPAVDPALRERLGEAAIAFTRAATYRNAGTVEFLLAPDGTFAFLEMNARLQVEHPVTEVVYDVDLVRAQLAIAEGAALPAAQRTLAPRGWALEARIAAEDPARDFAPAAGRIARFEFPRVVGMRLDSGFGAGSEVPIFYDSLLAKLIVHAPTRELACARLAAALERATIDGIPTNLGLLRALAREPDFLAGRLSTAYLGDHPALAQPRGDDDDLRLAVAALAFDPNGFRIGGVGLALRLLDAAGAERALVVSRSGGDDGTLELRGALDEQLAVRFGADGHLSIDLEAAADGRRLAGRVQIRGTEIEVERDGRFARLRFAPPPAPRSDAGSAAAAGGREIVAPMAGKIVALAVGAGDVLAAGELVAVLEAMKMEHRIEANGGGRVARVAVAPGSIVAGGATLVELEEPSP